MDIASHTSSANVAFLDIVDIQILHSQVYTLNYEQRPIVWYRSSRGEIGMKIHHKLVIWTRNHSKI